MKIHKTRFFGYAALFSIATMTLSNSVRADESMPTTLKEAFAGKFMIGATVNGWMLRDSEHPSLAIVTEQFDCITTANALKWGSFNPKPNEYRFQTPDRFVSFAKDNDITNIGHVLFWHSQTPNWVYEDAEGNTLTREALLARMRQRARLLAKLYGDDIKIWDVVNEAIEEDGSLRKTKFNEIIGDDFIEQAFKIAAEELPADAVLLYNDYGMTKEGRRNTVVAMINDFKSRGIRIDGIGVQGHWSMHRPTLESIDETMTAFAETGASIHVTEFDVDYLGRDAYFGANVDAQMLKANSKNNPYPDGNYPPKADKELADRYEELFGVLLKHSNSIDRVTFWGVTDRDSWLNNFPVRGRTNYPLLIDRKGNYKPALERVVKLASEYGK